MAMVKADGYGHGMLECAGVFADEGAAAFGVAEILEGIKLRENGIQQPIFIFTGIYGHIPALFKYNLTPVIVNNSHLPELSREAVQRNVTIGLHIKIDAGMGRQGCSREEFSSLVSEIDRLNGLQISGVTAHLPMADDRASGSTSEILSAFNKMLSELEEGVLPPECCFHIANSGGLFYFADTRLDMVRPGISLYGYYPDGIDGKQSEVADVLQPVMRFSSRIIQLRTVSSGTGLGYGHSYRTGRKTTIAVVPLGYANGYLRSLSGKASVLVRGKRAPTLGRISMNLTLVDVTDVQGVLEGDEVVFLGRQAGSEITADEIAGWMNTISYEVLCLFGNLNDRYYSD
jgi:alanine racemase